MVGFWIHVLKFEINSSILLLNGLVGETPGIIWYLRHYQLVAWGRQTSISSLGVQGFGIFLKVGQRFDDNRKCTLSFLLKAHLNFSIINQGDSFSDKSIVK